MTDIVGQFSEANGVGEINPITIDPTKINSQFPHYGRMNLVIASEDQDPRVRDLLLVSAEIPEIVGAPCATVYNGEGYDLAFLGFPLYAVEAEQALTFATQLLIELGY